MLLHSFESRKAEVEDMIENRDESATAYPTSLVQFSEGVVEAEYSAKKLCPTTFVQFSEVVEEVGGKRG